MRNEQKIVINDLLKANVNLMKISNLIAKKNMNSSKHTIISYQKLKVSYEKVVSKLKYKFKDVEKNKNKILFKLFEDLKTDTYTPKPLKCVHIPKKDGGLRELKIPCFRDKIIQRCVADELNKTLNPLFSNRSFAYRPRKTAHQAVNRAVQNVKKYEWVVDLDIEKFFDNIQHSFLIELLKKNQITAETILLIEKWLTFEAEKSTETSILNRKGVPQGSSISPILSNLYLHEIFDSWFEVNYPKLEFVRYADDIVVFCENLKQAQKIKTEIEMRFQSVELKLNKRKSKLVYCRRNNAKKVFFNRFSRSFQFLGFSIQETYLINEKKYFVTQISPKILPEKAFEIKERLKSILKSSKNTTFVLKELQVQLESMLFYYGKLDHFFKKEAYENINSAIYLHFKKMLLKRKSTPFWIVNFLFFKWLKKNSAAFFCWKRRPFEELKANFNIRSEKKRVRLV